MTIIDEWFIPSYCKTPEIPEKLENKWILIQTIELPILWWDEKWNMYNKVYIIEKDWKVFAWANIWKSWKKVFLPKEGIKSVYDQYFYFTEADWKILLYIEYSWVWIYYDENWKKYTPKWIIEKIEQKINKIAEPIWKWVKKVLTPVIESLVNTLHTEIIFPQEWIKIPERPESDWKNWKWKHTTKQTSQSFKKTWNWIQKKKR